MSKLLHRINSTLTRNSEDETDLIAVQIREDIEEKMHKACGPSLSRAVSASPTAFRQSKTDRMRLGTPPPTAEQRKNLQL
jgi:hypothetical protein